MVESTDTGQVCRKRRRNILALKSNGNAFYISCNWQGLQIRHSALFCMQTEKIFNLRVRILCKVLAKYEYEYKYE